MKKQVLSTLFISVFLFVASSIQAQNVILNLQGYNEQPYHFGFILGMNTMNFSVKTIDQVGRLKWNKNQAPDLPNANYYRVLSVTASASPGFSVGILGNLRLMKFVDLRFIPTLSFGSRSLHYYIAGSGMAGAPAGIDSLFTVDKKVNSTYLTFPLLIKYRSWRKDNYGAYLIGGINYSIDLAAVKKSNQNNGGTGTGDILLNPHDIGTEIGAGFDFYNAYFKLSVEAKMIFGLKNLVVNDNTLYSGSIDQLHSKIFMLSFTFE